MVRGFTTLGLILSFFWNKTTQHLFIEQNCHWIFLFRTKKNFDLSNTDTHLTGTFYWYRKSLFHVWFIYWLLIFLSINFDWLIDWYINIYLVFLTLKHTHTHTHTHIERHSCILQQGFYIPFHFETFFFSTHALPIHWILSLILT